MVITLGPKGTFSSVATKNIFPKEKVIYEQNFYSIAERLASKGGKAVLPLENSTHGTVREVWDFLYESDFNPETVTSGRTLLRTIQELSDDELDRLLDIIGQYCG